jgi:O-acetyl-ADP-ribose deacetylase (regulator of RNase III)
VIEVRVGVLAESTSEGVLRPVDTFLAPVSHASREVEQAGGDDLARRLRDTGEIPIGGAILTPSGGLPATFLIHVAVQAPDQPVSASSVRLALLNGLRRAAEWEIRTLSLPPLGTGAGNLEPEDSARLVVELLREHAGLEEHPREVTIVVPGPYEEAAFGREIGRSGSARGPQV